MLFFFPRGVLDEILNLIESVSEGFPSYFYCPYVQLTNTYYLSQLSLNHVLKIDSRLSLCWLQLQKNDNLTASAENKTKINNEELIQSNLISHPQSQKGKNIHELTKVTKGTHAKLNEQLISNPHPLFLQWCISYLINIRKLRN